MHASDAYRRQSACRRRRQARPDPRVTPTLRNRRSAAVTSLGLTEPSRWTVGTRARAIAGTRASRSASGPHALSQRHHPTGRPPMPAATLAPKHTPSRKGHGTAAVHNRNNPSSVAETRTRAISVRETPFIIRRFFRGVGDRWRKPVEYGTYPQFLPGIGHVGGEQSGAIA